MGPWSEEYFDLGHPELFMEDRPAAEKMSNCIVLGEGPSPLESYTPPNSDDEGD